MRNVKELDKRIIAALMVVLVAGGVTSVFWMSAMVPNSLASVSGSAGAVLLFGIGVHVEPLRGERPGQGDYSNAVFFERHVEDIRILARIVERYGGRLTVQAQTPFTLIAARSGETLFADLEASGHEIGLHFHEDAHLGADSERLPVGTWADVMSQEISYLKEAGATNVRYWSGGNLYPGVLDAAARVGLDVMSDWKNPHSQQTDELVVGVNPWRPSGGPSEQSLLAFAKHDPNGEIIYLPDGCYDPEGFGAKRSIIAQGGDQAYFDYLTESLQRSLDAAEPDRVNVFHITIHPGEFRGKTAKPYSLVDQFLSDVVSPLVKAGKIRWATFSNMADAFVGWEKTHLGLDPRKATNDLTNLGRVEQDLAVRGLDSGISRSALFNARCRD